MLRLRHAGVADAARWLLSGALQVWQLDYVRLAVPEARTHYGPTVESRYACVDGHGKVVATWTGNGRWEVLVYDPHQPEQWLDE